jgi:hypothetical protein
MLNQSADRMGIGFSREKRLSTARPCGANCHFGPNVMIGLGEIQEYQWFAGDLQAVFTPITEI